MSDDEEKKETCVVVLIGNDDVKEDDEEDGDDEEDDNETQEEEDGVKIARACAQRLYDVLNHTRMFSGHQVCGDPILLLDKSEDEIKKGIREAVQLVKDRGASWLIIYYAGHSFCDLDTQEIVIEPKADGDGIWLKKHVKKTVREGFKDLKKKVIKTIIFVDSCLDWREYEAAEDDNQLGDSKSFLKDEDFPLVRSCRYGFNVRDGCLFARAIERCARESFDTLDVLIQYVQEFAWQLSCGRLCPWSKCPEKTKFLVLSQTERRKGLLEKLHFLPFSFDLRTEDALELDPQTVDRLDIEGSDIDEAVKILKSIVKELETKQAAFEKPWCELEAIAHCESLEDFEKYLKTLDIPVRDVSELDPENVWIPENVRRAIVEVLQKKLPQFDPTDPKVGRNKDGDPDFQWEGLGKMKNLVLDIGRWYRKWEPQASETGISFLLDEQKKAYSVVVKDLDVTKLPESEMKEVAAKINGLCKDLGIPGRVYLVPGSLWIIFCLNIELPKDCRRNFTASLKSWIDQQKQSGANGWTLAQDPCWKPLYAVPDRILDLVRQVETLCGSCLPTNPTECMWLRASDLRNLVARERKLEEWRAVVLEGLMERSGDSWLQGTGTLGCYLLEHFEDERLDHRMQEIANLACKRKRSMRPEVQALVFLLQRAQQELTDEEWTQVVDSARVCYQHLKTVLCKVMLDKDTDLICGMSPLEDCENPSKWHRQDDESDWQVIDSGPVKDCENPSSSNGQDAAAAATAAKNSSGSGGFMRGWISGLNHIADQLVHLLKSRSQHQADKAEAENCRDIRIAAVLGNLGAVRHLLREDPDAVHERSRFGGREPLHLAAMEGHVDVVEVLLGAKASVDAKESEFGWTPLHCAAERGQDVNVERLLAAGANVDAVDNDRMTPYQLAERKGHEMVLGCLNPVYVTTMGGNVCRCNSHTIRTIHDLKEEAQRKLGIKIAHLIDENGAPLSLSDHLGSRPSIQPGITLTAVQQPPDPPSAVQQPPDPPCDQRDSDDASGCITT